MAGKLTDARLRAIKPSGKVQKISDGNGLYIHVTPAGSKLWRLAYTFDGKQKTLALGKYPEISLAEAKRLANEARERRALGIDPSAERKQKKQEARLEAEIAARTFAAVARELIEIKKPSWSAGNLKKKTRLAERFSAQIGDKPISRITPSDILEVIRPYDNIGKAETAHVMAQTASQICGYARICGYAEYDAGAGLTRALRPVESKHRACIVNPVEVGRLLRLIDEFKGSISVLFALKIMPYVPLRSTELRGAAWDEIDLAKALWIVPAARKPRKKDGGGMKMRIEHEIPLARQVVDLFRQLQAFNQSGPLCFPGRNSANDCITDMALLNAIRRMGYGRDEMCIHGFRGTFLTLLNEKKLEWKIDSDIIERQLAHAEKNAVRDAYNHATYLEERRRMMQLWADYLDELREAAK